VTRRSDDTLRWRWRTFWSVLELTKANMTVTSGLHDPEADAVTSSPQGLIDAGHVRPPR